MSIEAMKHALEALENYDGQTWEETKEAITSLRQAIAEAEKQEPDYWLGFGLQAHTEKLFEGATPVYLRPQPAQPKREWVGFSEKEKTSIMWTDSTFAHGVEWAEAKLKEKNT